MRVVYKSGDHHVGIWGVRVCVWAVLKVQLTELPDKIWLTELRLEAKTKGASEKKCIYAGTRTCVFICAWALGFMMIVIYEADVRSH